MRKRPALHSIQAIDGAALATVVGGRVLASKGPDPKLIQKFKDLAEAVVSSGQVMTARKQQGQQMAVSVIQQKMMSG